MKTAGRIPVGTINHGEGRLFCRNEVNMSIFYEKEQKVFHLQTKSTSYIMRIVKNNYLSHVYWGKKIHTPEMENAQLNRLIGFSATTDNEDKTYSLDFVCQEYPTGCGTDFRIPAVSAVYGDGSRNVQLLYQEHHITAGKPGLPGLPAVYVEREDEADTLVIRLSDPLKKLSVDLMYTAYRERDVITRSVRVINEGREDVVLEKVLSASVDFETADFDFITLPGAWGRERHIERTTLRSGVQSIESRRGASSHQNNPFMALAGKDATETSGDVYAFHFEIGRASCRERV